jgi:hypothetical protein
MGRWSLDACVFIQPLLILIWRIDVDLWWVIKIGAQPPAVAAAMTTYYDFYTFFGALQQKKYSFWSVVIKNANDEPI